MWSEEIMVNCDVICGADDKILWFAFPCSCGEGGGYYRFDVKYMSEYLLQAIKSHIDHYS